MTYSEKLRHPLWQKKRLEVLEHYGFECMECGSSEKTLHVHHRWYVAKRMPWEYPMLCYTVMCEGCHSEIHAERQDFEDFETFLTTFFGSAERSIDPADISLAFATRIEWGASYEHGRNAITEFINSAAFMDAHQRSIEKYERLMEARSL